MWVIATSAFAEGVDKAGLRTIFIFGLPYSLADVVQRMGRIRGPGRVTLWHLPKSEVQLFKRLKVQDSKAATKNVAVDLYQQLCHAVAAGPDLTAWIGAYFDDDWSAVDACRGEPDGDLEEFDASEVVTVVKQILEATNHSYSLEHIAAVLSGHTKTLDWRPELPPELTKWHSAACQQAPLTNAGSDEALQIVVSVMQKMEREGVLSSNLTQGSLRTKTTIKLSAGIASAQPVSTVWIQRHTLSLAAQPPKPQAEGTRSKKRKQPINDHSLTNTPWHKKKADRLETARKVQKHNQSELRDTEYELKIRPGVEWYVSEHSLGGGRVKQLKPGFRIPDGHPIEELRGFALGRRVSGIRKSKGKMSAGHAAWKRELDELLKEEVAALPAGPKKCEHGKRRSQCKECGGSGLCEHGKRRSRCKECGGSGICEHGRRRYQCKYCHGSAT